MESINADIMQLAAEFKACQNILTAIGDETRQHLILKMMQYGDCNGIRVGTITERTNLSRPAVSHHLQILKKAGIIRMRREGTKNYYSLNTCHEAMDKLLHMVSHAKAIVEHLPNGQEK